MLFLTNILRTLVFPLGIALLLALLALVFMRFRRFARGILALAIILLWAASMPAVAKFAALGWENAWPPVAAAEQPQADAIVVLGGMLAPPLPPRVTPDYGDPVDRVFEAARLYKAGKAPLILVTGGNLPWFPESPPEAELVASLLTDLGVPPDTLVLEGASRTTRENALNTKAIFDARGWKTALLVTSGFHMRRAMATFAVVGIEATAATADADGTWPVYSTVLDVLPSADALSTTTRIVKEAIGLIYYRLRGWA